MRVRDIYKVSESVRCVYIESECVESEICVYERESEMCRERVRCVYIERVRCVYIERVCV